MDKKSALSDTQITISGNGMDPVTMNGEEFEKRTDAFIKKTDETISLPLANRSLRYDFTAVEIHDYSLQLANKTKELSAIEEERKSVTSNFAAKINEAKATCNKLSNFISNGYEYRDIECTVEYHKPEQGKKTLTRKDNKEKIVEKMEQYEWNLFNQVTEEEKGLLAEA
jgi:phosphopantetheinyl transferase (holo-ACP synthase)